MAFLQLIENAAGENTAKGGGAQLKPRTDMENNKRNPANIPER
jgi:hypothetical protein